MLYRHLPKIANKLYSIFALDLRNGTPGGGQAALIETARSLGVNLAYAGVGADCAAGTRAAAGTPDTGGSMALILHFAGTTPDDLRSFLENANPDPGDILLVGVPGPEAAREYRDNGLFQAAFASRGPRVGACGFFVPGDAARPAPETALTAAAAMEADARWDCWSTPYSFLREDLAEAIRAAGGEGIPLIALDPFAGGALERPPTAVHELYRSAPVPRARDEWALRAIWECQDALTVACPSSGPDQLLGRVAFAEAGRPNSLPSRELAVLSRAAALFRGEPAERTGSPRP